MAPTVAPTPVPSSAPTTPGPTAAPTESNYVLALEFPYPGGVSAMSASTRLHLPEAVITAVTNAHTGIVRADILGYTVGISAVNKIVISLTMAPTDAAKAALAAINPTAPISATVGYGADSVVLASNAATVSTVQITLAPTPAPTASPTAAPVDAVTTSTAKTPAITTTTATDGDTNASGATSEETWSDSDTYLILFIVVIVIILCIIVVAVCKHRTGDDDVLAGANFSKHYYPGPLGQPAPAAGQPMYDMAKESPPKKKKIKKKKKVVCVYVSSAGQKCRAPPLAPGPRCTNHTCPSPDCDNQKGSRAKACDAHINAPAAPSFHAGGP